MKYLLFLGTPLFVLDQLTKWLVRKEIRYGGEIPIIPGFFSLVHTSNTGAAFSMLTGNNLFFLLLAIGALAFLGFLLIRHHQTNDSRKRLSTLTQISIALLVSGILGNLVDRLMRGAVTDFLYFYIRQYSWPSFNIADSCICIAAGLLILGSLKKPDKAKAS
jgi:signal peptidase II